MHIEQKCSAYKLFESSWAKPSFAHIWSEARCYPHAARVLKFASSVSVFLDDMQWNHAEGCGQHFTLTQRLATSINPCVLDRLRSSVRSNVNTVENTLIVWFFNRPASKLWHSTEVNLPWLYGARCVMFRAWFIEEKQIRSSCLLTVNYWWNTPVTMTSRNCIEAEDWSSENKTVSRDGANIVLCIVNSWFFS